MEAHLNNPVYNALISGDAHLGFGPDKVKYFDEQVSPFAGFPEDYTDGFEELYRLLPPGRRILYAKISPIDVPGKWQLGAYIKGSQFVLDKNNYNRVEQQLPVYIIPLTNSNAAEMVQLAALTKPGPFDLRTIEFGSYYGIFQDGKLAAMTGQRLHVFDYAEVSAVCTHPDNLGKGFATMLLQHQLDIILQQGQVPFLHVREDNARAVEVYERLGFRMRGPMHFYFMWRKD